MRWNVGFAGISTAVISGRLFNWTVVSITEWCFDREIFTEQHNIRSECFNMEMPTTLLRYHSNNAIRKLFNVTAVAYTSKNLLKKHRKLEFFFRFWEERGYVFLLICEQVSLIPFFYLAFVWLDFADWIIDRSCNCIWKVTFVICCSYC